MVIFKVQLWKKSLFSGWNCCVVLFLLEWTSCSRTPEGLRAQRWEEKDFTVRYLYIKKRSQLWGLVFCGPLQLKLPYVSFIVILIYVLCKTLPGVTMGHTVNTNLYMNNCYNLTFLTQYFSIGVCCSYLP